MEKQNVGRWTSDIDYSDAVPTTKSSDSFIGLREFVSLLSRRRYFITIFVLVSLILLAVVVFSMPNTYTAVSALVLDRSNGQALEAVTELDIEQRDRSAVETEMDIISSRIFGGRVVDAMNLVDNPWFNTYLAQNDEPTTFPARLAVLARGVVAFFGLGTPAVPRALPNKSVQRDRAITSLLSNLSVTRSGDSFAVTVRLTSPDPELSAALANTVANVYVDWSRELKKQSMTEAVGFLREHANKIASRIADNERAIAEFSGVNQLASNGRDDLVRSRIEDTNAQLTAARVELAGILANREQGRRITEKRGEIKDPALDSPLLTALRAEQALLTRQRAQYASNFGAGHPQIIEIDAQLTSVDASIGAEVHRIINELAGKEKVVNDRVQQLASQIADMQETLQRRALAEIKLRELERDLLADQKLHDLVVARLGGLDPFSEVAKPSARVVSVAEVPTMPSFPQKGPVLAGGFVGSIILAILLAAVFEANDARIRSGLRIAQIAQLRNIASIPRVRRQWFARGANIRTQLIRRPRSMMAEAFRSLFLACHVQITQTKAVVLVTAPLPQDGTSSVAFGLAFAAARHGQRTLYLDFNPSSLGTKAGVPTHPSAPAEQGTAAIISAIRPVADVERLDTASLLNKRQLALAADMRVLIDQMRAIYDLVVIDVAPVLILEDANWLSPFVDAVLLVTRFGDTTERELIGAISRLTLNRAPLIGSVLNCVDLRARAFREPLGAVSYPREARAYFNM